ncbi:hypothetical protein ACSMXM_01330 [Pacificimonas sp. ICDLI1SI03]
MIYLRAATASQEIMLGPFYDETDALTPETGLTIDATDIRVWKTGASVLTAKNSGGATHVESGLYVAVLDATDTATPGSLSIHVNATGALPVRVDCLVLPASVYDAMVAGSSPLGVNVLLIEGGDATSAIATHTTVALGAYDPATTTALNAGLSALSSNLGSVETSLGAAIAALNVGSGLSASEMREALGLATANLDTVLGGVKAQTDKLTFGTGNAISANITRVAGIVVGGLGTSGSPWGPQ